VLARAVDVHAGPGVEHALVECEGQLAAGGELSDGVGGVEEEEDGRLVVDFLQPRVDGKMVF
jgi:hypothetical protein